MVAIATLNFHRLIMGKNENWHVLLFHCRYFDDFVLEMFVEWSFTNRVLFVQMVVMATKRLSLRKILKNQLLKSYMGDEAETLQKCS